jgi:methionyl-tRNA synthetase
VHMIGKEIVRFHCVYWPAFLMAAGLPLPKHIIAHGWLLFEHDKMSKSKGNIVRSETILEVLGADALRYFLFREIVFGQDGGFSFDALVQRYNADLANGLGNLASRTLTMIVKYCGGAIPSCQESDNEIGKLAAATIANFGSLWDDYQFSRALEAAWGLVSAVDKFIVANQPWTLAEQPDAIGRLHAVLYTTAEALRIVTALVHPVLPESTAKIWRQLGLGEIEQFQLQELRWGQLSAGTKLGMLEAVFPRADKGAAERMRKVEQESTNYSQPRASEAGQEQSEVSTPPPPATNVQMPAGIGAEAGQRATEAAAAGGTAASGCASPVTDKIGIEDFARVELRVALVKVAERVKGADKLLRLEVDLGDHTRQILAGIAEAYAPETLIGRKIVIVANLQPRKLRGLVSDGMLLAASVEGGKPALASFLEDVPVGARLK